jgi:hypothetical protein
MPNPSLVSQLRSRYIELTKTFFQEIESGKTPEQLQSLQQEIENALIELTEAENRVDTGNS